jgi:uncharacterized protein YggE
MQTFLSAVFLVAATATFAQSPASVTPFAPQAETVSVTGIGRTTLTPDRYTFSVGVQTIAPTVDAAVNENNQRVTSVLAALKKAGAAEKEIRTSNFSIYPQQVYEQGQPPRITGYQVSNNITVTRDKVTDAGKLLQAAVSAGVNVSSGLQFQISDPTRGRDQGLKAAVDDARAKAALLAQAAGRTLGRALTIAEGSAPVPPPRAYGAQMMMMAKADTAEVPVESGTQEMTFSVSIVFELR